MLLVCREINQLLNIYIETIGTTDRNKMSALNLNLITLNTSIS